MNANKSGLRFRMFIRQSKRSQVGNVAIEVAFLIGITILTILFFIDVVRLGYNIIAAQNALYEAAQVLSHEIKNQTACSANFNRFMSELNSRAAGLMLGKEHIDIKSSDVYVERLSHSGSGVIASGCADDSFLFMHEEPLRIRWVYRPTVVTFNWTTSIPIEVLVRTEVYHAK